MTPSEDLFELIKSLSQTEKGYFKKFVLYQSDEEDANYVKLFDAIDDQEKYNEAALKIKFKSEKFINHLPRTKNYLYYLILKSLRNYNTEISINARLMDMLRNIEILYDKNLIKQCKKLVIRGKELAIEYENYERLIEFSKWEISLTISSSYQQKTENEIIQL